MEDPRNQYQIGNVWKSLPLPWKIISLVGLLTNVSALGSIADNIVALVGFVKSGIDLYVAMLRLLLNWLPFKVDEVFVSLFLIVILQFSSLYRLQRVIPPEGMRTDHREAVVDWISWMMVVLPVSYYAGLRLEASSVAFGVYLFGALLILILFTSWFRESLPESAKFLLGIYLAPAILLCVLAGISEGIYRVIS